MHSEAKIVLINKYAIFQKDIGMSEIIMNNFHREGEFYLMEEVMCIQNIDGSETPEIFKKAMESEHT